MKFIFGMQIKIKVSDKFIVPFRLCVARYAQSTQKRSLHPEVYLQKNAKDEVAFLLHRNQING